MTKPWLKHYDAEVPHSIDYPEWCIHELLDRSAEKFPDNTLSIFYGKTLTYSGVRSLSNSLAGSLVDMGIRPGDKVALLLPNYPGFIISYHAVLKAGGVVVPLNPLYTEGELEHQLFESEARAVITIPLFAEKASRLAQRLKIALILDALHRYMPLPIKALVWAKEKLTLSRIKNLSCTYMGDLLERKSNFRPVRVDPKNLAVLIYSGGTTGKAKGVMLSHFAVVANAHQIAAWGQLNHKERILTVLPMFHGYGMNVGMNAPILSGMSIVLLPRFKPKEMARAIVRYKPTTTAVVPTILIALSNLPHIDRYDFTSLKAVWVGAAPLTKAAKEEFEKKAKCRVIEGYGLTEAVTAIMANPYRGKHKVGSIGIPFPDVDAKVVSIETNEDLPPNQQGEIVLKTPTLMLGYYKRPEETKDVIKDGWLYTGDIGYMDEEGYFYITDRKKDLIIVGGFNVFPREIDEVIQKHPKVKEGIAVGVPDEYRGEKIKAYIVLKEGETATEEEFLEYFREHLAPYKVPKEVEFRKELPKNAIGKVLRRILREEELKKLRRDDRPS